MNITEIVVSTGRTFNNPHEQFSNLRPEVSLKAVLSEGEDPLEATKRLQSIAEGLVEDHKQGLLKSLDQLNELTTRQAEMRGLQKELERTQARLDFIRGEHPELQLAEANP